MLNKLKNIFKNENKKTENLIFFLIVLVITLIFINRIMTEDENISKPENNFKGTELVKTTETQDDLEERLENILSKISGVGEVSVLITYSESGSILPLYNETTSTSKTEEEVEAGNTKVTETNESKKEIIVDSASEPITQKSTNPKIEGAIITAKGANNSKVKENIISAVEAATGLATHKIQVFEMN